MKVLLSLILLAPWAGASDFHVDAASGNDAFPGTEALPFRTITHALVAAQNGPDVIHVATGVYNASHGESFPLVLRDRVSIVGADQATTILHGPASALIQINGHIHHTQQDGTGASNLTLWGAQRGIRLETGQDEYQGAIVGALFRNLTIRDCGVGVDGANFTADWFSTNEIRLERVDILDSGGPGITLSGPGVYTVLLEMIDCNVVGSSDWGLSIGAVGDGVSDVLLQRCTFSQNYGGAFVGEDHDIEDCLFARNMHAGLLASQGWIRRSTIAGNGGPGLENNNILAIFVDRCIVYGNATDYLPGIGTASMTETMFGQGNSHVGMNGNFTGNPLFRSPAAGDFRLSFGSPGIDAGGPVFGELTDRRGTRRGNDGDLDLVGALDLGAFEFSTLEVLDPAFLGQAFAIELHGHPGEDSLLFVARGPATFMQATPFGRSYLDAKRWPVALVDHDPGGNILPLLLPNDPALIGETLSLQALSRSPAAPASAAWGDPVTVTIE